MNEQNWISVNDSLPKDLDDVIVFYDEKIRIGFYLKAPEQWFNPDFNCKINGITHWMPLPPPPEQDEKK